MIRLIDKGIIQVDPIVIPPRCYLEGRLQDCHACKLHHGKGCGSPMSWCICEYPGHKHGCPNYGLKDDCSPNMPLLFDVFDLEYPVYAAYTCFDFKEYMDKMKALHPGWSERQCRCVLYWQAGARKTHREFATSALNMFLQEHKGYWLTDSPEAMGTNVTSTLKKCAITLEWPCKERTYKISLLAKLKDGVSEGTKVREKYAHLRDDGYIVFKREQRDNHI